MPWIKATDRLPDDAISVLIHVPQSNSDPVWIGWLDDGIWRYADGTAVTSEVMHWMDIPEGPKQ